MPHPPPQSLVKLLYTLSENLPHSANFLSMIHLGCEVPRFLARNRAISSGLIKYRGYEEDQGLVDQAAMELPALRVLRQQLDTVTRLEADVILVGPGIFRLCGGGAAQLLTNLNSARCSHLVIATVPTADNATRESLITTPRTHVPLDAVAMNIIHPAVPARLHSQVGHGTYAHWERSTKH